MQSMGPPHLSATALPSEGQPVIDSRARAAWNKVIGLIGYFDLDPSRALDIILDVMSTHVTLHYSFFLSLLRVSTWHRVQEHAPPPAPKMEVDEPQSSPYKGKSLDEILQAAEGPHGLKPKNPEKPQVCAEVLGFKFVYYQVRESFQEHQFRRTSILGSFRVLTRRKLHLKGYT